MDNWFDILMELFLIFILMVICKVFCDGSYVAPFKFVFLKIKRILSAL